MDWNDVIEGNMPDDGYAPMRPRLTRVSACGTTYEFTDGE